MKRGVVRRVCAALSENGVSPNFDNCFSICSTAFCVSRAEKCSHWMLAVADSSPESCAVNENPSEVSESMNVIMILRSEVFPWSCFSKAKSLFRQTVVPVVRFSGMRLGDTRLPSTWLTKNPTSRLSGLKKHRPSPGVKVSCVLIVMVLWSILVTVPIFLPSDFCVAMDAIFCRPSRK